MPNPLYDLNPLVARLYAASEPPAKPQKPKKPASPETIAEHERLKQVIADNNYPRNEYGCWELPLLEGIYHPPMADEWLAPMHMIASKFTTQAEVARLMGVSATNVQQRYVKRKRMLISRVIKGLITEDQIVT